MDPYMRLTVRQFSDTGCHASPSEVLTDQENEDTVKKTAPKLDSDDQTPKLHIPSISEAQSATGTFNKVLEYNDFFQKM